MKEISLSDAMAGVAALSQRPDPQSHGGPPNISTHHEPRPDQEQQLVQTDKVIRKEGSQWVLVFSDGRKEKFKSKKAAEKRERQIQFFKHKKK